MLINRSLQINKLNREDVECNLEFAGFLVFHCPLKPDAVRTIKMLNDSSHRVSALLTSWRERNDLVLKDVY